MLVRPHEARDLGSAVACRVVYRLIRWYADLLTLAPVASGASVTWAVAAGALLPVLVGDLAFVGAAAADPARLTRTRGRSGFL